MDWPKRERERERERVWLKRACKRFHVPDSCALLGGLAEEETDLFEGFGEGEFGGHCGRRERRGGDQLEANEGMSGTCAFAMMYQDSESLFVVVWWSGLCICIIRAMPYNVLDNCCIISSYANISTYAFGCIK
jgi:hypothetical protein